MPPNDDYKLPRLYIDTPLLEAGQSCALTEEQAHYVRHVMRMRTGDSVRVFNGHDGEWRCDVKEVGKRGVELLLQKKTGEQVQSVERVAFAPLLKKEAFEWMLEKSSELGVTTFQPVITDHTVVHRMNLERAQTLAVESAEQCERLQVMKVLEPMTLKQAVKEWDAKKNILAAVERRSAEPVLDVVRELGVTIGAYLVGPEGGFSEAEKEMFEAIAYIKPVSLGSLILRAETAMLCGLSCLQCAAMR